MNTPEVGRPLAAVLIVACVTLLTGGAFVLLSTAAPGWLSGLVGVALFVLVVFCVRVLLGVLEQWMDRSPTPQGGP